MPDILVDGIYIETLMENTRTHVQNNVDTEEDGYRLYTVRVLFKIFSTIVFISSLVMQKDAYMIKTFTQIFINFCKPKVV